MNQRNGLIVLTIAALMAVLFCLPGPVAGGGNPPVVGEGFKITGPNLRTTVIMGWRNTGEDGSIDAFIRIDDNLYMVRNVGDAQGFIDLFIAPEDVWDIPLGLVGLSDRIPLEIATEYGVSGGDPVIADVQDVSDYEFQCLDSDAYVGGCQPGPLCPTGKDGVVCYEPSFGGTILESDYQYVMHATVKLSFIVDQSGKP